MQRISNIAILAISAFLIAANPPAGLSQNSAIERTAKQPEALNIPSGPNGEGTLWNSMGWSKVEEKTGIVAEYYFEGGLSTNNTLEKGVGTEYGDANDAVGWPSDPNTPNLEQIEQFIHRNDHSNIVPGVTPTPAPMLKKFDWGFLSDTVYGRTPKGCLMTGLDSNWAMNPSPANDAANRYMYLCQPNAFVSLYMPFLQGVTLQLGRMDDTSLTNEIPPAVQWGPNNFYSKSYGFYRDQTVLGGRLSATVMHSKKNGYIMAEFGINEGYKTTHTLNGSPDYNYALRYRTPKMDTWIDYTGRIGDGNITVKPGCSIANGCTTAVKPIWVSDDLVNYHLFSPNKQALFENSLAIKKEFRPRWTVLLLVQFGKQSGDGASSTIAAYTPAIINPPSYALNMGICNAPEAIAKANDLQPFCRANFTGASYLSYEGVATYAIKPGRLSASLRLENWRDPNGFFGVQPFDVYQNNYLPNNGGPVGLPPSWGGIKGAFNEVTGGLSYNPIRYLRLRPEIRYDWQSGNYGANAFGQNNPNGVTSSTQVTAAIDTVVSF